jgi:hypothetical protein
MVELLKARKADGIASDLHVFASAATNEFDRKFHAAVASGKASQDQLWPI